MSSKTSHSCNIEKQKSEDTVQTKENEDQRLQIVISHWQTRIKIVNST